MRKAQLPYQVHRPDTDEVRQQLAAAFGSLPIPHAGEVIGPTTGDTAGEERIRAELAGKPWQSLSGEFLREHWASFCYLSGIGYRYYLPALLARCLDDLTERNSLVHSTLYSLAPSYWAIYYRGRDEQFDSRTALLNAEQYAAVCSFLGLCFESLPGFKYLSAAALRWGWNRQEHPALTRSREFYDALYHYTYPPAADPAAQTLIEQIRTAFADTPYPGDDALCGSEQGDEPAQYALEFCGTNWRTLHTDFLTMHYASLSFFTNAAFRYFLPAYLIADVMGYESGADPVFHLTHGLSDAPDHSAIHRELVDSGTMDQATVDAVVRRATSVN